MDRGNTVIYVDFLRKIKVDKMPEMPSIKRVTRLLGFVFGDAFTRARLEQLRRLAEDEERRNT